MKKSDWSEHEGTELMSHHDSPTFRFESCNFEVPATTFTQNLQSILTERDAWQANLLSQARFTRCSTRGIDTRVRTLKKDFRGKRGRTQAVESALRVAETSASRWIGCAVRHRFGE